MMGKKKGMARMGYKKGTMSAKMKAQQAKMKSGQKLKRGTKKVMKKK